MALPEKLNHLPADSISQVLSSILQISNRDTLEYAPEGKLALKALRPTTSNDPEIATLIESLRLSAQQRFNE